MTPSIEPPVIQTLQQAFDFKLPVGAGEMHIAQIDEVSLWYLGNDEPGNAAHGIATKGRWTFLGWCDRPLQGYWNTIRDNRDRMPWATHLPVPPLTIVTHRYCERSWKARLNALPAPPKVKKSRKRKC